MFEVPLPPVWLPFETRSAGFRSAPEPTRTEVSRLCVPSMPSSEANASCEG
jgi:hypothetical protein